MRSTRAEVLRAATALVAMFGGAATTVLASDPWATHLVSYDPGTTPAFGYTDASTALGSPERFTGEGFGFPSVVSVFSPAFGTDELTSIGEGGHLVVSFDRTIRDDSGNPYGVDLNIFGNAGFVDDDYPNGRATDPATTFGVKSFVQLSVSADGVNYVALGTFNDGFFPAQGYLDGGPYDTSPGTQLSDFLKPVNPALALGDFDGKSLAEIRSLYDGSGGGTPIDIAASGLSSVRYVRLDVPDDGDPNTSLHAEVDGFAVVPEPGMCTCFVFFVLSCARRRG